jgi:hypothetical protein
MAEFLKVKDNKDLVRQKQSNAILNTNLKELNKYKEEREEKMKLKRLVEESEQMKNDIDEIKSLLRQLIGQK